MRTLTRTLAVTWLLAAAACGGDEKLTMGSLAGTWDATEYLWIDQADHNNAVDVLVMAGVSLSVEMRANGMVIVFVDGTAADTSAATLSGDVLDLGVGGDDQYRVTRSGGAMTWTSTFTVPYDFDNDGTDETAFEQIRWQRS